MQSDPIGLVGGVNTFGYVGGDPLSRSDPLGLTPSTAVGAGIGTFVFPGPGTVAGAAVGTLVGIGIGWWANQRWGATLAEASRPKDLTALEERQYDRVCAGSTDPCQALKDEANKAIQAAVPKMQNMLLDPRGLFGSVGWITHGEDLAGRISQVNAIISLGEKLGCDMSQEKLRAAMLAVPIRPIPK